MTTPEVDPLLVAFAVDGYPCKLNSAEREQVVEKLTERGYSATEIAQRLRLTPRAVTRIRTRQVA